MGLLDGLISLIPEVSKPMEKKLSFKKKLYWTLAILIGFFILGTLPLYGLGEDRLAQFETLSIIIGASFGSLMTLGIGPIVTASIVLSLLQGSGIINFDTSTEVGKKRYHGISRLLGLGFVLFEAIVYVKLGALAPATVIDGIAMNFGAQKVIESLLILQLIIGGFVVLLMDDVINKWGFGSGISLFIVAGVAQQLVMRIFNPFNDTGSWALGLDIVNWQATGFFWSSISTAMSANWQGFFLAFLPILSTVLVFSICVFVQSMKIEIPLQIARYGGFSYRHPLNFLYTSNIPVIFIAALLANVQLLSTVMNNWVNSGSEFISQNIIGQSIGWFTNNVIGQIGAGSSIAGTGISGWATAPNVLNSVITQKTLLLGTDFYLWILGYTILLVIGSMIFAMFWVQTSGADAHSLSRSLFKSGLQIPGTRSDPRILERHLSRYIMPLTIMGGIAVGLLAAFADLMGAATSGTGILLAVMIIYKMYEDIAKEHMGDFNPAFKKMIA